MWYRDAIIYEVHVRSFYDSDGDGIGDLPGLTQRLDYIEELGVTALWLLPFYPSPLKDDGYDIASYTEIHPDYGTLHDFRDFLHEAHRRGLKVITELVINHTSDQHPWFQRARKAPPGSPERDFYVWSDTTDRYKQARILFPEVKDTNWTFEPTAGQYYWHRFYAHQPDLNFDNPLVREAIFEVVDFWLEMGIDGLRLDAITYLFEREGTNCESLPETHQYLRDLRAHIDARFDDRMLLAEANQWPEDAVDYFGDGDECHMAFHFPLMPRLFMAIEMEDRYPIVDILEQTPPIPEGTRWALFLRNHDELTLEMVTDEERDFMYRSFAPELRMRINLGIRRRLAPMLRGDKRKIRLLYALLLTLPGTPIIYYGDEIGMGDNYHLGDRDGVRTPMQWAADRNAGFSRANPQSLFLPVVTDPEYHYLSTNVETQENNPSSLLRWIKRLIAIRKRTPAFAQGDLEIVHGSNHRVLAYIRSTADAQFLVVLNLSRAARHLHLDLTRYAGLWPIELWGHTQFPPIDADTAHRYPLSLGPYDFFWFKLSDQPLSIEPPGPSGRQLDVLEVRQEWTEVFQGRMRTPLLNHLVDFLRHQRWFNPRRKNIDVVEIDERVRLRWDKGLTVICLLDVRYLDGHNELYVLPLEFSPSLDEDADPQAVVASIRVDNLDQIGHLRDATANPSFGAALLGFIRRGWRLSGLEGDFSGHWLQPFQDIDPDKLDDLSVKPAPAERRHTTMVFGDKVVMKLFRRLERGPSVDVEIGEYLLDRGFDGAAPLMGHLDYRRGRWEPTSLITIHEYIPHQTTAWRWYTEHVSTLLSAFQQDTFKSPELDLFSLLELNPQTLLPSHPGSEDLLDGARQLGRQTADLHHEFAAAPADSPHAPIPLDTAYERARYQAMRTLLAHTFRLLRRSLPNLGELYGLARWVLEHEFLIQNRFRNVVGRAFGGLRTRIHGDYHLAEMLITHDGTFMITGFEGHPWLPVGERRIKRSPLRDVAAMMRSFHLAGLTTLDQFHSDHAIDADDPRRLSLFHGFQNIFSASTAAFVQGYLQERPSMTFLPPRDEDLAALLDTLRLKKSLQQLLHALERRLDPHFALIGVTSLLEI